MNYIYKEMHAKYVKLQYAQISLPTNCTMLIMIIKFLYMFRPYISWPSSGRYNYERRVQHIWQILVDDWQIIRAYDVMQ